MKFQRLVDKGYVGCKYEDENPDKAYCELFCPEREFCDEQAHRLSNLEIWRPDFLELDPDMIRELDGVFDE